MRAFVLALLALSLAVATAIEPGRSQETAQLQPQEAEAASFVESSAAVAAESSSAAKRHGSCAIANWWSSFNWYNTWNVCPQQGTGMGGYMTGMYRTHNSAHWLGSIEEADCCTIDDLPVDHVQDMWQWTHSFDHRGWSTCPDGYYLQGLYKSSCDYLWCIEAARCARPPTNMYNGWESCYDLDVWSSFDNPGWARCNAGYYLVGLWRNDCSYLYCIEWLRCCKPRMV